MANGLAFSKQATEMPWFGIHKAKQAFKKIKSQLARSLQPPEVS